MGCVFFNKKDIAKIGKEDINRLKQAASKEPRKTARLCLHRDIHDSLHEMIIVHRRGRYVRPHKHIGKSETLYVIKGSFFIIVFNDKGEVIDKILMDANKGNILCRLKKNIWHMVIPISNFIVFLEVTEGPFNPGDNVFASWSPERDDVMATREFIRKIMDV